MKSINQVTDNYDSLFKENGVDIDPESNVVGIGAHMGKFLSHNVLHDNLVTLGVYSCIAIVATSATDGHVGLWHLFHEENRGRIQHEMMPAMKAYFDPASTEIYLIGGKIAFSQPLAHDLKHELSTAGYNIADTALFGAHTLDVAVTHQGGIYACKTGSQEFAMTKPAWETKFMMHSPSGGRGRIWLPEWSTKPASGNGEPSP